MSGGHHPSLDRWNPMAEDYGDPSFNSYVGRKQDQYEMVQKSAMNGPIRSLMGHEVFALHIRKVPMNMTEDGLMNIFSPFGSVLDVKMRTPNGLLAPSFQYGKVYFKKAVDAVRALEALNNRPPFNLNVELDWHSFGDKAGMTEPNVNMGMNRRTLLPNPREAPANSGYGDVRREKGIKPVDCRVPQGPMVHEKCERCNVKGQFRCSRCKIAIYCSAKCQTADWSTHKNICPAQTASVNAAKSDRLETSQTRPEQTRHRDERNNVAHRQPFEAKTGGGNSFGVSLPRNASSQPDYKEKNQGYKGQPRDLKDESQEYGTNLRDFKNQPRQQKREFPEQPRDFQDQDRKQTRDFKEQPRQQSRDFNDQPRQQSRNFREQRDNKEQPHQGSRNDRDRPQSRQNFGRPNDRPRQSGDAGDRKDDRRGPNRGDFQNRDPPAGQRGKPDSHDGGKSVNSGSSTSKPMAAPRKFHPITLGQSTKVKAVPTGGHPHSFYVQLDSDADLACIMVKVQAVESNPSPQEVSHSEIVAAKWDDGVWYRARVETVEKNKIAVLFIDYGNVDKISMENLRVLPKDIANLPLQAVWCRLVNVQPTNGKWSKEALGTFQLLTENLPLYANLVKTRAGQSWINLYNEPKNGNDIGELLIEAGCASPSFPIHRSCLSDWQAGTSIELSTPTIEKLGKLWGSHVQGIPAEHFGDIMANLAPACKALPSCADPEAFVVGAVVAAESPSDGGWYRAMILSGQSPSWLVRYVDFGNCEEVTNVLPLPAEFLKFSSIAICLRLDERYAVDCVPEEFSPDDTVELKVMRLIGDTAMVAIHFGGEGGPVCPGTASSVWKFEDGFELQNETAAPDGEPDEDEESECPKSNTETKDILTQPESAEAQKSATPTPRSIVCDAMANLPPTPLPDGQAMVMLMHVDSLDQFRVQIFEEEQVLLLAKLSEDLQVAGQNEQLEKLAAPPAVGQLVCGLFSQDENWYRCLVESIDANDGIKVRFIDFGNTEVTTLENLKPMPHEFYETHPISMAVSVAVKTDLPLETVRKILIPSNPDDAVPLMMTIVDKNASPITVELTTTDGRPLEEHLMEYAPKLNEEDEAVVVQDQVQETEPEPAAVVEKVIPVSPVQETESKFQEVNCRSEAQTECTTDNLTESEVARETDKVLQEAQETDEVPHETLETDNVQQDALNLDKVAEKVKKEESPVADAPSVTQLSVGQTVELYVGEAQEPNVLFVCKLEPEELVKYDKLAEDISTYCCTVTKDEDFVPKEDEFCLAKSEAFDQWFRAIVIDIDGGKCQVMFADYGNLETVEISNTRKMVDAFREIPLQAIQVLIDGISQKEYNKAEQEKFKEIFPSLDSFSAEVLKFVPEDMVYVIRVPSKTADLKKNGFLAD